MTATGRKVAWVVGFTFIAAGGGASATQPAGSAPPDVAAQAATPIRQPLAAADDLKLAAHFSGRVTGPDGQPVGRARVYVAAVSDERNNDERDDGDSVLAVRAETDADGRFEFDAPDMVSVDHDGLPARRECIVSATADGYGVDWIHQRPRSGSANDRSPGTDLELRLAKDDVPIHGRLVDADGRSLAGAHVRITKLIIPRERDLDAHLEREKKYSVFSDGSNYEKSTGRPYLLPVTTETRTDADGRFTFSGLGRDRVVGLAVSAPSVVDTYLAVMTRDSQDVPVRLGYAVPISPQVPAQMIYGAGFTLPLKQGRTISGVVRDRDSHEPISGMRVGTGRENYPRDGVWDHETLTDAAGRFRVTGLDPSVARWSLTAASAPGMDYQPASVTVQDDSPVVIECQRGIPFRLKLVDEQGRPVEAEVAYYEVMPNPYAPRAFCFPSYNPLSQALRKSDGTYEGFVLPGPGAVLVKTPGRSDYRPAQVDPQAFFAPDRDDEIAPKLPLEYGTRETLQTVMGATAQSEYAAIVLVNPAPDSPALELSATVAE